MGTGDICMRGGETRPGSQRAVLSEEQQVNQYPTATLEGTGPGSPVEKEKNHFDFADAL